MPCRYCSNIPTPPNHPSCEKCIQELGSLKTSPPQRIGNHLWDKYVTPQANTIHRFIKNHHLPQTSSHPLNSEQEFFFHGHQPHRFANEHMINWLKEIIKLYEQDNIQTALASYQLFGKHKKVLTGSQRDAWKAEYGLMHLYHRKEITLDQFCTECMRHQVFQDKGVHEFEFISFMDFGNRFIADSEIEKLFKRDFFKFGDFPMSEKYCLVYKHKHFHNDRRFDNNIRRAFPAAELIKSNNKNEVYCIPSLSVWSILNQCFDGKFTPLKLRLGSLTPQEIKDGVLSGERWGSLCFPIFDRKNSTLGPKKVHDHSGAQLNPLSSIPFHDMIHSASMSRLPAYIQKGIVYCIQRMESETKFRISKEIWELSDHGAALTLGTYVCLIAYVSNILKILHLDKIRFIEASHLKEYPIGIFMLCILIFDSIEQSIDEELLLSSRLLENLAHFFGRSEVPTHDNLDPLRANCERIVPHIISSLNNYRDKPIKERAIAFLLSVCSCFNNGLFVGIPKTFNTNLLQELTQVPFSKSVRAESKNMIVLEYKKTSVPTVAAVESYC